MAARRREQGTISGAKPRTRDLPAQHLKLVAQDQQLDVLDVEATATADEHPKQSPKREVQEGEGHTGDPPTLAQTKGATRLLAPFTPKRLWLRVILDFRPPAKSQTRAEPAETDGIGANPPDVETCPFAGLSWALSAAPRLPKIVVSPVRVRGSPRKNRLLISEQGRRVVPRAPRPG
jgi:hypothetical protein